MNKIKLKIAHQYKRGVIIDILENQKIEKIKSFITDSEKLFDDVKINIEKHWKDFMEILDKKNLARKECLLLPFKTILKALKI